MIISFAEDDARNTQPPLFEELQGAQGIDLGQAKTCQHQPWRALKFRQIGFFRPRTPQSRVKPNAGQFLGSAFNVGWVGF